MCDFVRLRKPLASDVTSRSIVARNGRSSYSRDAALQINSDLDIVVARQKAQLAVEYDVVLRDYLYGIGEAALKRAYDL